MDDVFENQWKWNVRSSKADVNPDEMKSLQASKGILETFLKQ